MQCRLSDSARKPDEKEVNCRECRFGGDTVPPKMNVKKGRYCYRYSTREERSRLLGAANQVELLKIYNDTREWQRNEGFPGHFEDVLKGYGMCVWSWPFGEQEVNAVWVTSKCSSDSGLHMPYPNLPLDEQPNLFFEYMDVYLSCRSDYFEYSSSKRSQK
jgi:hypothetical protein